VTNFLVVCYDFGQRLLYDLVYLTKGELKSQVQWGICFVLTRKANFEHTLIQRETQGFVKLDTTLTVQLLTRQTLLYLWFYVDVEYIFVLKINTYIQDTEHKKLLLAALQITAVGATKFAMLPAGCHLGIVAACPSAAEMACGRLGARPRGVVLSGFDE